MKNTAQDTLQKNLIHHFFVFFGENHKQKKRKTHGRQAVDKTQKKREKTY